jgi:hypothetical protein
MLAFLAVGYNIQLVIQLPDTDAISPSAAR